MYAMFLALVVRGFVIEHHMT